MARKRYSAEQIILKLREAEVLLAQGQTIWQISCSLEISEQTYYRWRREYGGSIRRSFRKVLRVSKLPKIRFHDLRHTAASLMLNHGILVLVASKRLGHSKHSITMDVYGHLLPSKQEEAAPLLDNLIA